MAAGRHLLLLSLQISGRRARSSRQSLKPSRIVGLISRRVGRHRCTVQTLAPDVVLLDISMPKLDGVGTLRRVSELGLQTRVILLSAYATDEYIFDGLRAGAGGYLLKDVSRDELANAIRTVHEGGSLLHPVVAKRLIEQLDNKETSGLSDREIEVIMLLASGARNKEIATQLSVTIHTVKFHLDNVYRKLGVQTRAEAVRVASERGILNA